jgi:hypothetical protein
MRCSVTLSALAIALFWNAAHGAPVLTNIGTLTCTTETTPGSEVDASLSCQFHALSGRDAQFRGWIVRKGPAALPAGKRVLVWTAFARRADAKAADLAGTFEGLTGGASSRRVKLKGGRGGAILLVPVTTTSQLGERPVPSVLKLRLEPARA